MKKFVGFEPCSRARSRTGPPWRDPGARATAMNGTRLRAAAVSAFPVGQLKFDNLVISSRLLGAYQRIGLKPF
ncbi:MAG TPA: hypothetical protein EYO23_04570 [Alphaproteobacteria bacterium]|nr:hypothetical protein [Alphaproteobacteria bacterium]